MFGNTVYSASLVIAVFMLGLGVGSHQIGTWADRRYAHAPGSLLRAYGHAELAIAILGCLVTLIVPHLGTLVALLSGYSQGADGWYVPSLLTYTARIGMAIVLLLPITVLMGGTLTLLIRHLVRQDLSIAPARIAALYTVNTIGAAVGCFLTDFTLIPAIGQLRTQMVAVALNTLAGVVALAVATVTREIPRAPAKSRQRSSIAPATYDVPRSAVALVGVALGLAGFAALGMEILWFRHATILLGGFRAVFALLLTVVLTGIAIGAYAGGAVAMRTRHTVSWWMVTQAVFVATAIAGILIVDARPLEQAVNVATSGLSPTNEIWFNVRPLLLLAGLPSIAMGASFPFANALVQQAEGLVARRAGGLYLANTAGAVCGSIVTGFLLLPSLGIQASAAVLAGIAALAIVALLLCARRATEPPARAGRYVSPVYLSLAAAAAAIAACVIGPGDFVIRRAIGNAAETRTVLAQREGVNEVVTIAEANDSRLLLTNGHAMSSTAWLSQRYMRALAHVPLLMMDNPASVLVIGFGVGNTTHAATLHPSVRLVEVADLSRNILEHASYFEDANQRVLQDRRVHVFVNDGRQHLQMQPPDTYDLITLEPPPIGYAGVAALYSKEFYELARSRLTSRGFVSQWLPTYQVSGATALSMIRAFVDVFPQSVLLSGAQADLVLIGTAGPTIELDPDRLASTLMTRPAVRDDLERLDMGSVREIAGAFVGSARTLRDATANVRPVTDDWPSTEYSVLSALNAGEDVPASVVTLDQLPEWCPGCFVNGEPVATAAGLDVYMRLIDLAYRASPEDGVRLAQAAKAMAPDRRRIAGSDYLGAIVPETAELYNILGMDYARRGAINEAIVLFRKAVELGPDFALAHWHLGAALAQSGARDEAIGHLQRSVDLDPMNRYAKSDLDALTAASRTR